MFIDAMICLGKHKFYTINSLTSYFSQEIGKRKYSFDKNNDICILCYITKQHWFISVCISNKNMENIENCSFNFLGLKLQK